MFLIDEGYYQGGKFQFETEVPDAYNMVVSSLCLNLTPHPHNRDKAWKHGGTAPGAVLLMQTHCVFLVALAAV